MARIEEQYVRESERIIKEYRSAVAELNNFQLILEDNKSKLLKLQDEIEALSASDGTDLFKKQKLYDLMTVQDKEVMKMQDVIMPYVKTLERLKKEAATLYGVLKEKYPGTNDKDLQEQIFSQLDERRNSSPA